MKRVRIAVGAGLVAAMLSAGTNHGAIAAPRAREPDAVIFSPAGNDLLASPDGLGVWLPPSSSP